jgi:hypothetical protein
VAGLAYVGAVGPETHVVSGKQIPQRFIREMRSLGLLEEGETVQHFYSDALLDIKDGLYAATDRKVVLYSQDWDPPAICVAYSEIADLAVQYSDSWLVDGELTLLLTDGSSASIPLSKERGGDRRFVEYVRARMGR